MSELEDECSKKTQEGSTSHFDLGEFLDYLLFILHAFKKETVLKYNLTLHSESHYEDQILASASKYHLDSNYSLTTYQKLIKMSAPAKTQFYLSVWITK